MENTRADKIKAFEFLSNNRFGVLSTISSHDNTPQGAVVYYVVVERSIYFITTFQSLKYTNLTIHNYASLTVFSEIPPVELQIGGSTEIITDPDKKSYITKIYLESANKNPKTINWPPILKIPHEKGFEFFKISVDWFKFSDFSEREGNFVEGTSADWE